VIEENLKVFPSQDRFLLSEKSERDILEEGFDIYVYRAIEIRNVDKNTGV
jgi:hypothetical protein